MSLVRPISRIALAFVSAFAASTALVAGAMVPNRVLAAEACWDGATCIDQGWSRADQEFWYTTTQGSRLLPLSWALALEEPTREGKFLAEENMRALGYLPSTMSNGLPLGFTVDQDSSSRSDIMCDTFPETCAEKVMRQPWFGMTCSACHTNEINYGGKRIRVDGAPTMADFQGLLEQILAALQATLGNQAKFERFASAVLGADDTPAKRAKLKIQLGEQIGWQKGLIDRNAPAMRYGYGRLDAQGHILNKVATVGKGAIQVGALRSDAPASYPFIWNTAQHDRVQWNGIAANKIDIPVLGESSKAGALVRNTSEVIGVFAHIEVKPPSALGLPLGHQSSLRVQQMFALERNLEKLKSPRWPQDILPTIDAAKAQRGRALFESDCASCHRDLGPDDLTTPIEAQMSGIAKAQTDIFLACNTFAHTSGSGNYGGRWTRVVPFVADKIEPEVDYTRKMLSNAAIGAVVGRIDDVVNSLADDFFRQAIPLGPTTELRDGTIYLPGVADPNKVALAAACFESEEARQPDQKTILAYKARPLNGIWATAPYLHNGSVPTLYDLLLPSPLRLTLSEDEQMRVPGNGDRPSSFHVGSRNFDPVKVGFETGQQEILTRSDGQKVETFEFRVYDPDGRPIPGNYNSGHDYGTQNLSEQERWDLVEYLKTL